MSMDNGCDFELINSSKQMSSSSYCSEDDSNASQELNAETSLETKAIASSYDKNGKKKGRRGSAIDPQSLYARVLYLNTQSSAWRYSDSFTHFDFSSTEKKRKN